MADMQDAKDQEAAKLIAERQAQYFSAVWRHTREICPPRFDKYSQLHGSDPLEAAAHYYWNAKVSESLLPTLIHAEVLLRNAIDKVLVAKHGEFWFDSAIDLRLGEQSALAKARDDAKRKEDRRRRVSGHNDIVVELSFRFWTNLLLSEYSRSIWNHLLVYGAFPNLPHLASDKRKLVRGVFSDACDMRNRVCHGEYLLHLQDVKRRQAEIIKAIGWISMPTQRIVQRLDSFPDVWDNGLNRCRVALVSMIPEFQKQS